MFFYFTISLLAKATPYLSGISTQDNWNLIWSFKFMKIQVIVYLSCYVFFARSS